jgi:hypothetical protein
MQAAYKSNAPLFPTNQSDKNAFGINMTEDQLHQYAENVYQNTERGFDSLMKANGITMPPSSEREGLLSIYHQNPALLSKPAVIDALKSGDRAQLVKVLQDPKNMPPNGGLRQRRLDDIKLIGQPDDPDVIRNDNNSQSDLDAVMKGRQSGGTPGDDMKNFIDNKGGAVHVDGYVKADGTVVGEYFRSYPGEGSDGIGSSEADTTPAQPQTGAPPAAQPQFSPQSSGSSWLSSVLDWFD